MLKKLLVVLSSPPALAAIVAAIIGASVALTGQLWSTRSAVVQLLGGREAAQSKLRVDMLNNLVTPFAGTPKKEDEILTPARQSVLLQLLALNFHDQFELKPLFEETDKRLLDECSSRKSDPCKEPRWQSSERRALSSVARRVLVRQVVMLEATPAPKCSPWYLPESWSRDDPTGRARTFDLRFQDCEPKSEVREPAPHPGGRPVCLNRSIDKGGVPIAPEAVIVESPDGRHRVRVTITQIDVKAQTATVRLDLHETGARRNCRPILGGAPPDPSVMMSPEPPEEKDPFRNIEEFRITPFDMPLTDNIRIDDSARVALSIYHWEPEAPGNNVLQLKLVWFPRGYFTERERPMNLYQVRALLHMQED